MANLNNIYFNAAFCGALEGCYEGRPLPAVNATIKAACVALATQVDSKIAFDALVTTNAAVTQLAITTNTIAANEQWRAGLLRGLCRAAMAGRSITDGTAADWDAVAAGIFAVWNDALGSLVTP